MSVPTTTNTPVASTNLKGLIGGIIIAAAVIVAIFTLYFSSDDKPTSSAAAVTSEHALASQQYNSPTSANIEGNLYEFANTSNGKIEVYIGSKALFLPKGGRVKVTPPSGNTFIDVPGTDVVRQPEPPGIFIFEKADSSAWGVRIIQ